MTPTATATAERAGSPRLRSDVRKPGSAPKVSVLVPTLNSARTLGECLDSLRAQDYPADCVELVVADAGSTDSTLEIARAHGAARIVENPLRTGEAGKAAAFSASTGELLLLLDSDNVLPSPDWLRRMAAAFDDPSVSAAEPLRYESRPCDPPLVRYFAQLGMNDPLCLYLGTYDRECAVTRRWTDLPVETEDRGDFLLLSLHASDPFPTIGANGFMVRRRALDRVRADRYWFDVDVPREIAAAAPDGTVRIAKVKTGVVHLYCDTLDAFVRKQNRRIRDYLYFSSCRAKAPPPPLLSIARFSIAAVFAFPLLRQARRAAARTGDEEAWKFHLPACRATLRVYASAFIRRAFCGKPAAADRSSWRQ